MKIIVLGAFALFFVALPLYVFNALVTPELNQLQQSYAHQDQTVQALFPQP